jgi:amino acid adenylation domain-containing protein
LTPEQLFNQLEASGVNLSAEGGRLRANAPKGGLTDELKSAIAASKDALIALLERRSALRGKGLVRVDRAGPLPVSPFQERLWILQRLEPGSSAYNIVHAWKNPAGADTASVVAAIESLLERHEILRSCFDEAEAGLVSRPLPRGAVRLEVRDLSALAADEQRRQIDIDMNEQVGEPFDLTTVPPTRFVVYRLADSQSATLLTAHHIAVDDWSLALLEKEVTAACAPGAPPAATALPQLQYTDYAAWQRATTDPSVIAADLDWWTRYMAQAPQLSVFPPDLPVAGPTSLTNSSGATHSVRWSPELAAGIRALARKESATLYMTLMAACATVLRWHTGQEDFVLGSPMGARERTELESMIGPFVNLLLVRLDVKGDPTFAELLGRTRNSMLEAHERRHVPFEMLLERLKPARNVTHSPLFQIALVHHNAPQVDGETGGESVRRAGGAMHELTWFARETAAGLECSFEYRADLYSAATIERIAAHLETVLRGAAEDSERRLSALAVLSRAELAQLAQFYDTAVDFERTLFVTQFELVAARQAQVTALVSEGVELTYGELNLRANRLAHALRAKGAGRGTRVALCLERAPLLVVALLAIQKASAAYVPLDPGFPADRRAFMLADSEASILLTANDAASDLDVPTHVAVIDLTGEAAVDDYPGENPLREALPEDPAYVIYTSGSTGRPKGVVVSHGSLMNLLWSMAREPGLAATDRLAAVTTISFDIAGLELYLPLLVGARLELVPLDTAADGPALAKLLRTQGITVLQATPATWRLLVEAEWEGSPGLRAFCGGEALPQDLAESLLGRVSELWNLYGPTETTIWSTAARIERASDITIGRPVANTAVFIASSSGTLQPIGAAGEIWIGGAGVAIGYLGRPELTAERFVADPFGTVRGSRVYRTGDLGRWRADGRLEHLGRLDAQVKIRGFRIELGEIEAALATLDAVRQAVVVARDAGLSDRRLVAYLVYEPGEDLTVSEVRRHLRSTLPDYMIPSLVVTLDAVPLTPNGKVDRAALPDPFGGTAVDSAEYEPPISPMAVLLASVWSDVLKVERVGLNDNFFHLGGHSLLSLRVAAAVATRSGWRMDPRALFFQTLGQLAATGTAASEQMRRRA